MANSHERIALASVYETIRQLNLLFLEIEDAAGSEANLNKAFLFAQIGVELTNAVEVDVRDVLGKVCITRFRSADLLSNKSDA